MRRVQWSKRNVPPEKLEDGIHVFLPPDRLEWLQNYVSLRRFNRYGAVKEFSHLRGRSLSLEEAGLTDRQLLAVCLVFYGAVSKKRAASAMSITAQSLDEHLRAALKKVEQWFCE